MRTSVKWINDYLDRPADASEQAAVLTAAGLPLDGGDTAENGEIWQEIETTSNRGDCLCHVGMAREIAASTGRSLRPPTTTLVSSGLPARDFIRVTNHEHAMCPRYTARVIRGVTVAASLLGLYAALAALREVGLLHKILPLGEPPLRPGHQLVREGRWAGAGLLLALSTCVLLCPVLDAA